jgi:protein O-mannosyl-transferase
MKRNGLLAMLAAALLATLLLAYSNHFRNPFQFDDSHTIETNSAIRDLHNVPRFFVAASTTSSLPQNADYRPGLTTLNAIDYALAGGLNPFYFHRSIFVSYLILGGLLYLFYLRIGQISADRPWLKLLALAATGWFMLHAANAETINYIIQRGDSFSTLMVVLAFVIYLYKPGWRRYYLYLIPMVLGFFVKLPAVMFAPLLFVYDLLFERSPGLTQRVRDSHWPQTLRSLTIALPALGVGLLLALLSKLAVAGYWSGFSTPIWRYLITQPFVFVHYFDNFLLPIQLSVDTDWKLLASPADDRFFVGIAFILLMLGIAGVAARRKESRPITFGILWFFIALLPTSSFIPLDEVLNDHRPFFAYIGLVLACSWALGLVILRYEASIKRSRLAQVALASLVAVVLLGNAYGTYQRNQVWSSPESLWYDATLKSPGNGRALMNYGLTQMAKGNYDVALDYYQQALRLVPNYSVLHVNLGILYAAMNQPAEAEHYFRSALQLGPNVPSCSYYYARWLADQGRISEARTLAAKALSLSPGYADAAQLAAYLQSDDLYGSLINSSLTHYRAGDFEKSIQAAQSALEVKPESAVAYNNICAAYNALKQWDKAIEACARALGIDATFALAKNNLAAAQAAGQTRAKSYEDYINDSLAFYNAGEYQSSVEAAQKALAVKPDSAIAYNNICAANNALKLWDKAIEACRKALVIDPAFQRARSNLNVAQKAKP